MSKVLVVDDDQLVRKTLTRFLSFFGFETEDAATSAEALEIAEGFKPDVAVVDWMLGESVYGYGVAATLRERFPHLAVVFISGYQSECMSAEIEQLHGARFLSKPFTPDELAATIRELVPDSP